MDWMLVLWKSMVTDLSSISMYSASNVSGAKSALRGALNTAAELGSGVTTPDAHNLSKSLSPEQQYGADLIRSALTVSVNDVSRRDPDIQENNAGGKSTQKFLDGLASDTFKAMRNNPDQMATSLNYMFDKSPQMKGVALKALPKGNNSQLLESFNRMENTPQKPALQAMALLKGDSKISFNTSEAASYLKQAESNLDIANQYVKAMNYAVDNGFVSNTELSKLHDGSDVPKLIEHCLVLDSDAPSSSTASTRVGQELQAVTESGDQRYNEDLMALLPKMMGSVAKRGGSSAEKNCRGCLTV